ncbi:hypothetical protein [Planctomicrobium piriforme]|uniref:Uncharacterized protein n=1 Tax=Planctomicrobium piriforme TaxID=1576369 RepID=A0A1I3EBK7_9PLAN|nr:hypothetical protein [Planctomicrobium piriforme]SFH96298.1 hypothetical protein SAMN05421753_104152 [Planctomicrobium piriforme]
MAGSLAITLDLGDMTFLPKTVTLHIVSTGDGSCPPCDVLYENIGTYKPDYGGWMRQRQRGDDVNRDLLPICIPLCGKKNVSPCECTGVIAGLVNPMPVNLRFDSFEDTCFSFDEFIINDACGEIKNVGTIGYGDAESEDVLAYWNLCSLDGLPGEFGIISEAKCLVLYAAYETVLGATVVVAEVKYRLIETDVIDFSEGVVLELDSASFDASIPLCEDSLPQFIYAIGVD